MVKYTNRYREEFTFTKQQDGNVLWEGNFDYCRFGCPNDYKKAYQQYRKDGGYNTIDQFKEDVHQYSTDSGYGPVAKKYLRYVTSNTKIIDMVDPSGGPFLRAHMELDQFGEELKGLKISDFIAYKDGYLIRTYGVFDHLADLDIVGGIVNRAASPCTAHASESDRNIEEENA